MRHATMSECRPGTHAATVDKREHRLAARSCCPEGFDAPAAWPRCSARAASSREAGRHVLRAAGGPARAPAHAVRRPGAGPRERAGPAGAGLHGRRRLAGADGAVAAPARLPHLPLAHPRQRRLHGGAAAQLEARLEAIAPRRGSRVQIVGHSLGGMLARGLAVRRPDLVAGIVTLGSPMLAPAAHHASLTRSVDVLVRLSRAGVPGLMSEDCVAGALRPAELRGEPAAVPPASPSPRSTPGATASSTGGPASTRSPRRRGHRLPRRHGGRPAGRSTQVVGGAARREARGPAVSGRSRWRRSA